MGIQTPAPQHLQEVIRPHWATIRSPNCFHTIVKILLPFTSPKCVELWPKDMITSLVLQFFLKKKKKILQLT